MSSHNINESAKITLVQNSAQKYDGFFGQFFKAPIHMGIFFAIICAILIYYILEKQAWDIN